MCSTSTLYCTYSVLARPAIADFSGSVGARSESTAIRMKAVELAVREDAQQVHDGRVVGGVLDRRVLHGFGA